MKPLYDAYTTYLPQILRGGVMSIPGAEGDSTYERGGDARRLA